MNQAPPAVQELITRFERNLISYKSQGYNETQLRREFLDPFFEALGWDVANKQGHAEAYKDVIHEDAIKIGGATKAPDYCFRIGRERKFFLEAKKPAVNVKDEISPAYQLRRYAWSAKLPLSVLSDFEEFAAYDCRIRPSQSDKPAAGRILYLTFRDYSARWDEIVSIFAKDSVLKGSFDKYAASDRKRGTATVDKEFLIEIDQWRTQLAKNLAARNPRLSVHDLNFSIQRTIDRLIFLRISEDRGIEPYAQLQALLNGTNVYARLRQLYDQADDRYNSGLFHFKREQGRAEAPDELTLKLKIDDKILKDIIDQLYYPKSPYEFSVFPIEILGQVYEQFLGKVIRLTTSHQAKVEDKPEVKKAGGVYYTPRYIVDYIVKQAVGVLCEGKMPKQIAKLRVLDPACGSGSFLIGAFSYLMDYHQDWYVQNGPEQHKKELYKAPSGEWRLTTQEKKRILLNNIYGVDIDSQAVEVTKLSLLLKVLEGESDETLKRQLSFIRDRALPDLGNNIKCGNSLIGPDYFSGQLLPDEEEMRRVNPFDWKAEFPVIMQAGGFDAVIGNPPWGGDIDDITQYIEFQYPNSTRNYRDTFKLFIDKGLDLTRERGLSGMIVPSTFMFQPRCIDVRRLVRSFCIKTLWNVGDKVFGRDVVAPCCVFTVKKETPTADFIVQVLDTSPTSDNSERERISIAPKYRPLPQSAYANTTEETFVTFYRELGRKEVRLQEVLDCRDCGIKHQRVGVGLEQKGRTDLADRLYYEGKPKGAMDHRYLIGADLDINGWFVDLSHERYFRGNYKNILRKNEIVYFNKDVFDLSEKIVWRQTSDRIKASIIGPHWFANTLQAGTPRNPEYDLKYVLGLLNSKFLSFIYLETVKEGGRVFPQVKMGKVRALPFRAIDFTNLHEKSLYDKMVNHVTLMLELHKRLASCKLSSDKRYLERQIESTDREIDTLVYDLYGLTAEEIKIVEAASVASLPMIEENKQHEERSEPAHRPRRGQSAARTVAEETRHASESGGGSSESPPEAGESVDGVRESTGEYGAPEESDGESEESALGSTRIFETAEGVLTYTELSERLAVPLIALHDEILLGHPDRLSLTTEWLCQCHKRLAGHLFPDWAGRYRDVNVQVGPHTPPPFYEVPIHMRQFCDDLSERLKHVGRSVEALAPLLSWADWRFQWIHPFRDFNGRIGRVLLAALLYKFGLPHVTTAPDDREGRRVYLEALRSADAGELEPLNVLWKSRLMSELQEE